MAAPTIKTEKEDVLPDSTEDVTGVVKQDLPLEENSVTRNQEIKQEEQTNNTHHTEEKTGK